MDNKSLVLMAAKACDDKKAKDIKLIKIDKVSFISEWILIAEGLSDVQVRSITNSVEGELREKAKIEPIRKEGINEAKWALLDYLRYSRTIQDHNIFLCLVEIYLLSNHHNQVKPI